MNDRSLLILGRQPALGIAELESLLGAEKIQSADCAAIVNIASELIPFKKLGGSQKLAKLVTILDSTNRISIESCLEKTALDYSKQFPEGKLKLGISVYGISIAVNEVNMLALKIKKTLVKSGRSVRIIPNKTLELNAAQILHNKLTSDLGCELLVVKHGDQTIVAQTVQVQDIDAYAARDQARPFRDAKVGMLPPKLAQIIINLANPNDKASILDPFCGTGVILQEALISSFGVYGTDISPTMIEYSKGNLNWLEINDPKIKLDLGDATTFKWSKIFDSVASETYLGQPFNTLPPASFLNKNIRFVNNLHEKFLINLAKQTLPSFRLCLAVPAWKGLTGFIHLPVIDHLEKLGYTRLSFVHVKNYDLIYHREGQVVARELLVLKRN